MTILWSPIPIRSDHGVHVAAGDGWRDEAESDGLDGEGVQPVCNALGKINRGGLEDLQRVGPCLAVFVVVYNAQAVAGGCRDGPVAAAIGRDFDDVEIAVGHQQELRRTGAGRWCNRGVGDW